MTHRRASRRRRRLCFVAIAATVLSGAGAVITAGPADAVAVDLAQHLKMEADAVRVTAWADAHNATGTFWDPAAHTFVVRVPDTPSGGTRAVDAAARQDAALAGLSNPVTVRPAAASEQDIDVDLKILADQAWTAGVRDYTWSFFYDVQRDVIVIQTLAPSAVTDPLRALLHSPIDLQHAGFDQHATRNDDVPPFYGGAGVRNEQSSEQCTTGFAVQDQFDEVYLTTAGHCGDVGDRINTLGTMSHAGIIVGFILRKLPFPLYDSALIFCSCTPTYAARIWTSGTTHEAIGGTATPVVGQNNWFTSGSVSNYHGGRTIDSTNAQLCTNGNCTPGIMAFHGTTLCRSGDSGAPVFQEVSGKARVGGVYIGAAGTTMYAEKWNTLQAGYQTNTTLNFHVLTS